MTPSARAAATAAPFAGGPALVIGIILWFAVGWIAGLVAFVVIGVALAGWARQAGEHRILAHLPARPADPRREARLCNLVEGLSTGAGVRHPRLLVVDSPGLNAMAYGTNSHRATVAVTSGLLAELDRIELEAVLAEELYLIRHQETVPATVLAATFGLGRSIAQRSDHDASADQGAISLTRYPPALASALEKIERKGPVVAGQPAWMAHLWLADPRSGPPADPRSGPPADPRSGPPAGPGRLPLAERTEALREL